MDTRYSNFDNVVLVTGETHRSMEENTKSRHWPIQIGLIDSWQRCKRNSVGNKQQSFQQNGPGTTGHIAPQNQINQKQKPHTLKKTNSK